MCSLSSALVSTTTPRSAGADDDPLNRGERTRLTTRLCLCRTITRDGGPGAAWALAWFSFTVGTGVDIFPVLLLFFAYSITVYVRVSEIRSIRQCFAAPAASTYLSSRSPGSPSAALAPCQRSKHEAAAARARALTHHFTHSTPHASRSHTHRMTRLVLSDAASHSPHARQQYNMRPPLAIARRSQRPRPLEQDSVHHGSLITRHTNRRTATSGSAHTKPSIHQRVIAAANVHPSRARLGHPRAHLQPLSQSAHPPAASSSAYTLDTISSSRALALHSQLPPASCLK